MLRYIFISLLVAVSSSPVLCQQAEKAPVKKQSGIALGVDLAPIMTRLVDKERIGIGFNGRVNLKNRIFAVGEFGYEKVDFIHQNMVDGEYSYYFDYKSNGSYFRGGLDYNIFNVADEPDNHDNVLIGFRYGVAWQDHYSTKYIIGNSYWDDYVSSAPLSSEMTHWGEIIFGLRCEVLKNFYMGWTVRLKGVILKSESSSLDPAYVPGYGQNKNALTAGFTYTLEYQIPFNKTRKK